MKIAIQAQQTKTASLSSVGRSEGSGICSGAEASSERLFRFEVREELLPNVINAATSAASEGLITISDRIESERVASGSI
jgi:hypothetical protein